MGKLTEQQLHEGRELLRARDIDGFMVWFKSTGVMSDSDMNKVRHTFESLLQLRSDDLAIRLFDESFPYMNTVTTNRPVWAVAITLFVLGSVGFGVAIVVCLVLDWLI